MNIRKFYFVYDIYRNLKKIFAYEELNLIEATGLTNDTT